MSLLTRRLQGAFEVDPWGLDPDLVAAVSPLFGLRWGIEVDRAELVPAEGPALLLTNRRWGLSEPFVVSRGIRLATGRFVRITGAPDLDPLGTTVRRLGAVLERPDEVAGLLRAGHLVAVPLARDVRQRGHAGAVPTDLLGPAFDLGVPVLPVAAVGREVGRRWRVRVGAPVEHPSGRGPLAVAELADRARAGVQELLDEALPPRRWP